jgi:hypothetical protein
MEMRTSAGRGMAMSFATAAMVQEWSRKNKEPEK